MTSMIVALLCAQTLRPPLVVQDEGVYKGRANTINCTGAGVTCSVPPGGSTLLLNAPGGAGGSGLPADPAACPGGQFVTDQDASGVLVCSTPSGTYALPTADAATLGGIKVGARLTMAAGVLSADVQSYTLPAATTVVLGGVKQGANTSIDGAGVISVAAPYALPDATGAVTGGVRLTGDLGGTATSPTVPGLAGKAPTAHSHTTTEISGLDAGADFTTGVLPGARGGLGVALPTCSGTDKLTADGTTASCAADVSGGGAGGNSVTVSVDLGTGQGLVWTTTVTGQTWVTSSSRVICQPQATAADGQTVETYYVAGLIPVVSNLSVGNGFDLAITAQVGASGVFRFSCLGG